MKCPQCMQDWDGAQCTRCGYERQESPRIFAALPQGVLLAGRYRLGNALADSRQAIGYLAWDQQTGNTVLLEEFYPKSNAARMDNGQVAGRRNPVLFSQAQEMFLKRDGRSSKMLPCIDSFSAGGTAWRVYQPHAGRDYRQQMEALLDEPLLFRDHQDRVLMTINALPMPQLPQIRAYQPSGSIARGRRRRIVYRALVGAAVLLVAWFFLTQNAPVSVTLRVPLFEAQEVFLQPPDGELQDITAQITANEGEEISEDGLETYQVFSYDTKLKPGTYVLSITDNVGSKQEKEFHVSPRSATSVEANPLDPIPQVSIGAPAGPDSLAKQVIDRLMALGYLDYADDSINTFNKIAMDGYKRFAQNNSINVSEDAKGIYRNGLVKLMSDQKVVSVPYVAVGDTGPRANNIVSHLRRLHFLGGDDVVSGLDEKAMEAYQAFLKENNKISTTKKQLSVEDAKYLSQHSTVKKPDLIVGKGIDGQKTSGIITQKILESIVAKLKALKVLDENEQVKVFGEKAYTAFIKAAKTSVRAEQVEGSTYLYGVDINAIKTFLDDHLTPTPTPPPVSVPVNAFVFRWDKQNMPTGQDGLMLVQAGKKPGKADIKYIEPPLSRVTIDLGRFSHNLKTVTLRYVSEGQEKVCLSLPANKSQTIIWLPVGKKFELALSAEYLGDNKREISFDVLKPSDSLVVPDQAIEWKIQVDEKALVDFVDYNALPIPVEAHVWLDGTQLTFSGLPEDFDQNAVQKLYSEKKLVRQQAGEGKASKEVVFSELTFAPDAPFQELYADKEPLLKDLLFTLSPGPVGVTFATLSNLSLPVGSYTLSLQPAEGMEENLMAPLSFTIDTEPAEPLQLPFNAQAVRAQLKLSLLRVKGESALLNGKDGDGLALGDVLEKALLDPGDAVLQQAALLSGLQGLEQKYYQGKIQLQDQYGNQCMIPGGVDSMELEPGTYYLALLGSETYKSQELTIAAEAAAFAFDETTQGKIRQDALQTLQPLWMYATTSRDVMKVILSEDIPLDDEDHKSIFERKEKEYEKYYPIVIISPEGHGDGPVSQLALYNITESATDKHIIALKPYDPNKASRLELEVWAPKDRKPALELRPLAADDDDTVQAATLKWDILAEGMKTINFVLVDYVKLVQSKQTNFMPVAGAEFKFYFRTDNKESEPKEDNPITSVTHQGAPTGIQNWVLLPTGRDIWINLGTDQYGWFNIKEVGNVGEFQVVKEFKTKESQTQLESQTTENAQTNGKPEGVEDGETNVQPENTLDANQQLEGVPSSDPGADSLGKESKENLDETYTERAKAYLASGIEPENITDEAKAKEEEVELRRIGLWYPESRSRVSNAEYKSKIEAIIKQIKEFVPQDQEPTI
jgi:hypothetical protein